MTNKQNTVRHEGTRKYGHYANYDGVLKSLFGIRLMMRSFIKEFGESLHLPSLESGELELFPTEHVSEDFRLRRNDLIWKFKQEDGRDCYFLLMLEFQSAVDRFMAQRIMAYVALVYDRLKGHEDLKKHNRKLPQIYPVVLYVGFNKWNAPLTTAELIEPWSAETKFMVPDVRYALLDNRHLPKEALKGCKEAAGLFLDCARAEDPDAAYDSFKRFYSYLKHPEDTAEDEQDKQRLKQSVLNWYRVYLTSKGVKLEEIKKLGQLEEVDSMFDNCGMRWDMLWSPEINAKMEKFLAQKAKAREEGLAEGRAEGRVKGIAEGRAKGMAEGRAEGRAEGNGTSLCKLLNVRFGTLPQEILSVIGKKLDDATFDKLLPYALNATSLGEFESKMRELCSDAD